MQSFNVTLFSPEQLERLLCKLLNWIMVNYDFLEEHIQQINESYLYCMPTWFIILITILSTLIGIIGTTIHCYLKYK